MTFAQLVTEFKHLFGHGHGDEHGKEGEEHAKPGTAPVAGTPPAKPGTAPAPATA